MDAVADGEGPDLISAGAGHGSEKAVRGRLRRPRRPVPGEEAQGLDEPDLLDRRRAEAAADVEDLGPQPLAQNFFEGRDDVPERLPVGPCAADPRADVELEAAEPELRRSLQHPDGARPVRAAPGKAERAFDRTRGRGQVEKPPPQAGVEAQPDVGRLPGPGRRFPERLELGQVLDVDHPGAALGGPPEELRVLERGVDNNFLPVEPRLPGQPQLETGDDLGPDAQAGQGPQHGRDRVRLEGIIDLRVQAFGPEGFPEAGHVLPEAGGVDHEERCPELPAETDQADPAPRKLGAFALEPPRAEVRHFHSFILRE